MPKLNSEQVGVNRTDMIGRQICNNTLTVTNNYFNNKVTVLVIDALTSCKYLVTLKPAGKSQTFRLVKK